MAFWKLDLFLALGKGRKTLLGALISGRKGKIPTCDYSAK
jgi:hypothetical protein